MCVFGKMEWANGLVEELSKLDEECSGFEEEHQSQQISHHSSTSASSSNAAAQISMNSIETLFGPSVSTIWKKKKRKGRTGLTSTSKNLPTHISNLLGQANMKYISGDYQEAIGLYHQLIQIAPKLSDSYLSIGLIYDELGNKTASFHYLQFALKHAPRNLDLLFKVARLASDLGYYAKAVSIMNRIFLTEKSVEVYATRILLNVELGYMKRAKKLLRDLMLRYPTEYSFLIEYGACCYRNHFYSHGMQELLNFISKSVVHFKNQNQITEETALKEMQLSKIADELSCACQVVFEIYLDSYDTDSGLVYRNDGTNPRRRAPSLTSEAIEFQQSLNVACISTLHFYITHDLFLNTNQDLSENSVLRFWKQNSLQHLLANHVRVDRVGDCLVLSNEMRLIQVICELERSVSEKIKPGDLSQDPVELSQTILHGTPASLTREVNNRKSWYACLRHLFPILSNISRQEVALSQGLDSYIQSQQSKESAHESNLQGVDPSIHIQPTSPEQMRVSWLSRFIKTDDQRSDRDADFVSYEIGERVVVENSLMGEDFGFVEYRHRDDWQFFLYSRVHIATLLLSLGMTKKALSLSREVSKCPFLIPEIFPPLTIATILKRHCSNLFSYLMTPPADQSVNEGSEGTELVHEILQVCVRVLEFNPNEVGCLVIFTTLCETYQEEFVSLGVSMLSAHLETLLTHFNNSRCYFVSHLSVATDKVDNEEGEDDEGVEDEREGEDDDDEGKERDEEDKEGEEERKAETQGHEGEEEEMGDKGVVEESPTNEPYSSSIPEEAPPEYEGSLEENLEKIHSLPPSGYVLFSSLPIPHHDCL